jgi:hypothetical protein
MILVDEPWYNEPGRERTPNKRLSREYNVQIQQYTMQHAMIGWLNDRLAPPATQATPAMANESLAVASGALAKRTSVPVTPPAGARSKAFVRDDPIWGEIVRKHFAANGKAIMETVKKWKQQPPQGKELMAELQEALTRHGFI